MMNFIGRAKRLDDLDLPRLGDEIGVGEDEIHAILDVECRGKGFDSKGRPAMLFEPHVFYKQLTGAQRDFAVKRGLAYPKWGEKAYPKDSYPRLMLAMDIDPEAALRSASWGLGQIMGFNAGAAGYASAFEMVQDFLDDEETHLAAMIRFIVTNGLDDELRRHDWTGFARGYNGSGFAKHGYHTKLAAAFTKWQRIPDTKWKREQAVRTAHTDPEQEFVRPDVYDAAPKAPPAREIAPQGGKSGAVAAGGGAAVLGLAALWNWACDLSWVAWLFSSCTN